MKDVVSKNVLLESNSAILESIYDNVIEMNCEEQTLRYVKLNDASSKPWVPKSVRVVLWDAVNYWIDNMVYEKDRQKLHSTLKKVCNNQMITCNLKFRLIKQGIVRARLYVLLYAAGYALTALNRKMTVTWQPMKKRQSQKNRLRKSSAPT